MIFYFTGTGNSLYAANNIGEAQGDRLLSIPKLMDQKVEAFHYELSENELLGFVFPVFAWGPPKIVLDFIRMLEITGNPYVFSLCTCGDEEGKTSKIIRKALKKKGLPLDSVFTLSMPNNYPLQKFDVDSKKVEAEKLKAADLMLTEINTVIGKRRKNIDLTIPGKNPRLKSAVFNKLFNHYGTKTNSFSADDKCTGCKLCEKVCPVHSILVVDKPIWGPVCTLCLGCLNRCPEHAIQYGKDTVLKGRYVHPDLERLENPEPAKPESKAKSRRKPKTEKVESDLKSDAI